MVEGPTLTLRYATVDDAGAVYALARDPEVTRFFSWSYERPQQARDWIAGLASKRADGELLELLVVHRDRGVVGVTGLTELAARDRRAAIGTWLGREHWGSGVNSESKALIAALAFERLGMERLTGYAATENTRSQGALSRLGFHREGVLRAYHRHGERVYDLVVFRMLRAEWERSPLHAVPVAFEGEPPPAFVVSCAAPS